jgi:hypothetical protein
VNQILKLELGSILLCRHAGGDGLDSAIIQRFLPQSLYAKAHGAIVVQAQGNDPTSLVQEYIERVRHTLRFMASDTVARAQEHGLILERRRQTHDFIEPGNRRTQVGQLLEYARVGDVSSRCARRLRSALVDNSKTA